MRKPLKFFGLHAHSGASASDGLGSPEQHIAFCKENGLDGHAFTEHGQMNSFAAAYMHVNKIRAKGETFKYCPGVELYIHPDLKQWKIDYENDKQAKADAKEAEKLAKKEKEKIKTVIDVSSDEDDEVIDVTNQLTIENEEESKSISKHFNPVNRRHHLVALPKNDRGLLKLMNLVSKGYIEGFYRFPRVDFSMLKEAAKDGDIIVSSACLHPDSKLKVRATGIYGPPLDLGERSIKDVVEMVNSGLQVETLSANESGVQEFRRVTWGNKTRKNAKLVKLRLANGRELKLTPDHRVMTRRGWVEAGNLTCEDEIVIDGS